MAKTVLQEVETYVSRHHNTVAQFIATRPIMDIATRPIMDMCLVAEQRPGPRVYKR